MFTDKKRQVINFKVYRLCKKKVFVPSPRLRDSKNCRYLESLHVDSLLVLSAGFRWAAGAGNSCSVP